MAIVITDSVRRKRKSRSAISIPGITEQTYSPVDKLAEQLVSAWLPPYHREYKFHPTRKWRFDFAWPVVKVALEMEGGVFTHGRHSRGKGFEMDCHKYNAAGILGWRVFRVTGDMVNDGPPCTAVALMQQVLT